MKQRALNAPSRMLDDYASASGIDPTLAKGDIEDYVAAGRQTVKPMFDQALGTGAGQTSPAVWNPQLATISQRPAIASAIDAVTDDLANAGKDPTAFGFTAKDPATGKFVQAPRPTAEAWDMVKKRVSTLADRDAFGRVIPDSQSPGNYNLNVAGRDLTGALRTAIPGYGDALDASGDYVSVKKSFENGQDFILNPKVSGQQVTDHLAVLTPPEIEAFKGGIANQLFDKAQNGNLSGKLFYRGGNGAIAPIPAVSQKLSAALGPQNAQTFMTNLQREGEMAAASSRMRPNINSPTSNINEAIRQQDVGYGLPDEIGNIAGDVLKGRGIVGTAVGSAGRLSSGAIANWKTRGMPVTVRNEAGRLLMMHPSDLATYLNSAVSSPGIGQASNIVAQGAQKAALTSPAVTSPVLALQRLASPDSQPQPQGYKHGGRISAAASETDPEPTDAQIASGNYRKGKVSLHGFRLSIETPKGAARRGIGADGKPWENTHSSAHYGYITGHGEGADGDHHDAYIGPHPDSKRIFVVNQIDPKTKKFDETKTIFGARTLGEARAIYDGGFSDKSGPKRRWAIHETDPETLKAWLNGSRAHKPFPSALAEAA
jgi:hypothetical protein